LDNCYKLVIDDRKDNVKKELYDVRKDPGETINLIDQYPDVAANLEKQMTDWQTSVLKSLREQD